MESRLEWLNEEEGVVSFWDEKKEWMSFRYFVTGEEEAELTLQGAAWMEEYKKTSQMQDKNVYMLKWCLKECFRQLWNEGFEETVMVVQKTSSLAEILDSTLVAKHVYSEYMMKYRTETEGDEKAKEKITITEDGDGFNCENSDKTFFCRLLPYTAESPGERCFYLYEVEVEEKVRNKGIATACLKTLFRKLAAESPVSVYLQVGSYNEPAVHLYHKLGFEISEELCYYCMEDEPEE